MPYGVDFWSQDDTRVECLFGSAGGDLRWQQWPYINEYGPGGRGGGYMRLQGATVTIAGTVSANGGNGEHIDIAPNTFGGGGGSGGQIVLDSPNLTVTGTVEARGGDGSYPASDYSGGGGAGGRIKVLQPSSQVCTGTLSVAGGAGCAGMGNGEPGTLHIPNAPPSAAPTDLELLEADDLGRSTDDGLTKVARPRIAGNGPAESIIRLYEGPAMIGSGLSDASGVFAVPVSNSLPDGPHAIAATAQGSCNSESSMSSVSVEITIDTQPPSSPTGLDLPENSDTGVHDDDNITRDWGPQIAGSGPSDADITLYEGATVLGTTFTTTGEWTLMSDPLSEGQRQLTATAKDAAGNESGPSSALSILVDLTAPTITQTNVSPTECWPVGKVFDFTMTANDALSGMAPPSWQEATLRKDSAHHTANLDSLVGSQYSGSKDTDGWEPGAYTVDFRAVDVAGNIQLLENVASICLLPACPSDFDRDGDVDSADLDSFESCASGPAVPYAPGCEDKDIDHDGDVDQSDFGLFQRCYSGENNPADPNCAN